MADKEWLDGLKAGDVVLISRDYGRAQDRATVDRTTPTLVIVGRAKFRRADGYVTPRDTWSSRRLIRPTPELLHDVKMRAAREGLSATRWDGVSDDVVLAVWRLLRPEAPSDEAE